MIELKYTFETTQELNEFLEQQKLGINFHDFVENFKSFLEMQLSISGYDDVLEEVHDKFFELVAEARDV